MSAMISTAVHNSSRVWLPWLSVALYLPSRHISPSASLGPADVALDLCAGPPILPASQAGNAESEKLEAGSPPPMRALSADERD